MSGITENIKNILEDKKTLYSKLLSALEEEREILKRSDLDALWKMNDIKNDIAGDIENLRFSIIKILKSSGIKNSLEIKKFDLDELLSVTEKDCGNEILLKPVADLKNIKTKVYNSQAVNRQFVEEYLGMLEELVSVIANSGFNKTYSRKNAYPAKSGGLILNQEV
ncbi:MAG: flagellar export chaperone FlgN [Desulfobacteraceae bacterium]|nr:flagellar export chaperone FlgN [Desulfobacteraceae bacterium]